MFTLNAACHFYESLIDSEQQISFFEYGASDRPEWLFLPLLAGNEEIFKPLYSMAFDLIIQGILSRGDNNKMKTIIIIDELGALQELPSLNRLLSEGRKSGGSAIVGTQSLAQVVQVYGKEGAENFLQNTFTKFIFGCPNPNDSEQMARVIGKQDVWEESRSANYDWLGQQSTTRSWQSQEKDVVSPSEIQTLPDLEGYCVVADSMQVKKFRICPRDYGKLNTIFIPHPQSQVDPWQVDIGL
jgi:type IV secretory pathway TraG/TraD family ATPase VirD4